MQPIKHDIAKHPFLDGLSRKHLNLLAGCAMEVAFPSGDVLCQEGDRANRFYLILEGEVALELDAGHGASIPVQTIGPGETVGWSWLVHPYYSHLSARAVTPVKALFFYATWVMEECEKDHDLGYELLKRVTALAVKRLEAALGRLLSLHVQ
jgi:CRP-like cAMP-binding protein